MSFATDCRLIKLAKHLERVTEISTCFCFTLTIRKCSKQLFSVKSRKSINFPQPKLSSPRQRQIMSMIFKCFRIIAQIEISIAEL
jgi:hypothetical protein